MFSIFKENRRLESVFHFTPLVSLYETKINFYNENSKEEKRIFKILIRFQYLKFLTIL